MTYKETQKAIEKMQREMTIMNAAIMAGIPQSKAHYVFDLVGTMFSISSDYSMGETVDICVNGVRILRVNQEKEYAKSCKWSAKHGWVLINLTKKDFAKLINITERRNDVRYCIKLDATCNKGDLCKELVQLHDTAVDIVKQSVDIEQSVVKNLRIY